MDNLKNDNKCDNCLRVFKQHWQLKRHSLALRQCKKAEKDNDGNIISSKQFKCNDCGEVFTYNKNLLKHKREICKGTNNTSNDTHNIVPNITEIINPITNNDNSVSNNDNSTSNINNSTNINDNSISNNINTTNIDNSIAIKTYNSNNFAVNIGFLNDNLTPIDEFKVIDDNFINVINIEKYIKIFYKNVDSPIKIESVIAIIKNILLDKYVNNIDIKDRNIMTISSRFKMHYFKDGKWKHDNSYEHFSKNCIEKILSQMDDAIMEKLYIVNKIKSNDIPYLKTYNFTMNDVILHSIVQTKTENIFKNIKSEAKDLLHIKELDKRRKIYTSLHDILINPIMKVRVLAIMKNLMHVDNELREIFGTVPIKTSLPVKEV